MIEAIHIAVVMKPAEGNFARNAVEHGVVGFNVDVCRIGTVGEDLGDPLRFDGMDNHTRDEWHRPYMTDEVMAAKLKKSFERRAYRGRWPSNVILSHHPECQQKGVKRARGSVLNHVCSKDSNVYGAYESQMSQGHTDDDGKETVQDWNCHSDCPVCKLDERSVVIGMHSSGSNRVPGGHVCKAGKSIFGVGGEGFSGARNGDKGGASRFFKQIQEK